MTATEERDTDEALRTLQRVHSSYRETLSPEQHLCLSMRLRDWLAEAISAASGYCDEPEPLPDLMARLAEEGHGR